MERLECNAILFDLDGTLVDSTLCIEQHWRRWANQHGLDVEEIFKISHGRPAIETMRIMAPHLNAEEEARQFTQSEAVNLEGVVEVAGAASLVASLPPESWAIVTSGNYAIATNRLRHVALPIPQILITTDDVSHYKPHPEGYLKAAQSLGVAPKQCVVIEDAPVGIQAARAAHMKAIAIATTHPATALEQADLCICALTDISVRQVGQSSSSTTNLEILVAANT
ncbi:MAG: HAD family hydrolase [Moorea sp. SIO2I5]|nr:HAD family hydrolase [Moorena sp. SIO2I5]